MLCRQLLQSGVAAVGLDIEWRVLYQTGVPPRPVALIQVCFNEGACKAAAPGSSSTSSVAASGAGGGGAAYTCLLLHICHSGITPHLRQLLTSTVSARQRRPPLSSCACGCARGAMLLWGPCCGLPPEHPPTPHPAVPPAVPPAPSPALHSCRLGRAESGGGHPRRPAEGPARLWH